MYYIAVCDDEKLFSDNMRHILYGIFYEYGEDVSLTVSIR